MFEIGFWEIVVIFVVMLVVVGPERLPKLARTAGLWISKARSMVASVKADVERELQLDEIKRSIRQQVPEDDIKQITDQFKSVSTDLSSFDKDVKSFATDTTRAISSGPSTVSLSPPDVNPTTALAASPATTSADSPAFVAPPSSPTH
ncbi:MAG: Sec-independent protein translocase protein TatB [Gammaproteobacteria bacterium]